MPTPISGTVYNVWGSGPNDVYAVGTHVDPDPERLILHYEGPKPDPNDEWSIVLESTDPNSLHAVWGSGPNDVYAVGKGGTILHYDGNDPNWSAMTSATTVYLEGVWGTGLNDVFVVGDSNTILHYEGPKPDPNEEWRPMDSQTTAQLMAVRAVGFFDVFAVGASGTILRYYRPGYTLTLTIVEPEFGEVTVQPDLPRYDPNATVTLTAEPNQCRSFSHWEGEVPGGHETDNPLIITMDSDKDITAVFTWPNYILTYDIVNPLWGSVHPVPFEPNYVYSACTEVTLNAQPIPPRGFKHWIIYDPNHCGDANYAVFDSNNPITIVMMADREVTAVFKCGSSMGPMLPIMLVGLLGLGVLRRRR